MTSLTVLLAALRLLASNPAPTADKIEHRHLAWCTQIAVKAFPEMKFDKATDWVISQCDAHGVTVESEYQEYLILATGEIYQGNEEGSLKLVTFE